MAEDNLAKTASEFDSWQKSAKPTDELYLGRTTQNRWRNFCKMSPTEEMSADVSTTCCICDETYRDPMLLPCAHTFCLTCLQRIGSDIDKNPGDRMPCPVCRKEFEIPDDGFGALTMNVCMVKLIDITKTQKKASSVGHCDKHENKTIQLFCSDCNEAVCLVCMLERHKSHEMSDLSKASEILRSQLQISVSTAIHCLSDVRKKIEILLHEKYSFVGKIKECKMEVNQIRSDLKALIDQHADTLLQKIELLKNEHIENIEIEEKELDKHLNFFENVETRCVDLASTDRHDSLFCKMASELNEEIAEMKLANKSFLECQLHSFDIHFTKTLPSLSELFTAKNIIGEVKEGIGFRGKPKLLSTIGANNVNAANGGEDIRGMTVVDNDVFVIYEKNPVVQIYDYSTRKSKRVVTLRPTDLVGQVDFGQCVYVDGSVYIANRSPNEILRVDQNGVCSKWSTNTNCSRLSVSKESTIVATCFETHSLREYTLQGTLVHETQLCSTIVHPLHAIKLRNGHFVVSHGSLKDSIRRVCLVNDAGNIIKTFGGIKGSNTQDIHFPICLAVDKVGNILVLDSRNKCVLLLSPELKLNRVLITKKDGLRRPVAMHLDENTSRLYIADNNWAHLLSGDSKILVFCLQ